MVLLKDETLDRVATIGNVAQFVSFRPNEACEPAQSFLRIAGYEPNRFFFDPRDAVSALLAASGDGKVNVRSYNAQSNQEPRVRLRARYS